MWYKWVAQRFQRDRKGDYDFFINKDYKEEWEVLIRRSYIRSYRTYEVIVKQCDESSKNTALEYVSNLCGLSKIYMETR